jgi:hypothetical protein
MSEPQMRQRPAATGRVESTHEDLHEQSYHLRLAPVIANAGVELIDGDSVVPEAVDWIWPNWLARRKLHVLAGMPGTGKTTIALTLAACVTTGRPFPDGICPEAADVLVWSGEDDPADTLVPRLLAAGADMARVKFVGDVTGQDRKRRQFDPALDLRMLATALGHSRGIRLIVIDPLVAAIANDSHKNAEVRRGLAPLVDLAIRCNAALLGITHYSKSTQGREPLERVTGSLAFGAVPRLVFGTAKRRDGGSVLVRVKSNIGPDGDGFAYNFGEVVVSEAIRTTRIEWGDTLQGDARDLLDGQTSSADGRTSPVAFLREILSNGDLPRGEVERLAHENGWSLRSLQRHMRAAGVRSKKQFGAKAEWSLSS